MRLGLGLGVNSITSQKIGAGFTGLLDEYSGAAAAYSVRRLSGTYTGSSLRVRKEVSLVDEETDIGFDANGNLDTATLLSFASDADNGDVFVSIWYDQSGNGNDATNINESEQPLVVSGGTLVTENSKPAIQFDGVDDFLVNGGVNSVDWGFFSVLKVNETTYNTLYGGIYGSSITNNSGFIHHFSSGGYGYYTNTYNGLVSRSQTTYGQHLLSILIDSTTGSGYVNSVAGDVNKTLTSNPGYTLDIIGDTFAGRRYHGSMQELIIFDSDQSANRGTVTTGGGTLIEGNINTYFDIV